MHRTRDLLIGQRTQPINALRARLAELGLVADQGRDGLAKLMAMVNNESNVESIPIALVQALPVVIAQLASLQQQIGELDRCIKAQHRASDVSRRMESIPGIGVIGAKTQTWRPGSAWFPGRTQAVEKNGLMESPNRVTIICGASW